MTDAHPAELPEVLRALESRPLGERADRYLDVLEQLRGRLEDPGPSSPQA